RFLSMDPMFKGYPFYTPYQFAGNKPILCIDRDGMEEWVAIFSTSGGLMGFYYSEDPCATPTLGKGQIYQVTWDQANQCHGDVSTYNINQNAPTVNVAFIPSQTLVAQDVKDAPLGLSAYAEDAAYFKNLDVQGANFAAIECDNLENMVFRGVTYAIKNNVLFEDMII